MGSPFGSALRCHLLQWGRRGALRAHLIRPFGAPSSQRETFPHGEAPSPRELLSKCETEGVTNKKSCAPSGGHSSLHLI